jgi:hypothetical protein
LPCMHETATGIAAVHMTWRAAVAVSALLPAALTV